MPLACGSNDAQEKSEVSDEPYVTRTERGDGTSTLTAAKLEETLREINRMAPPLPPDPLGLILQRPGSFMGFDIIERPEPPARLRVSDEVPMTAAARASMNAWLLERFGRVPDLGILVLGGRYLSMTKPDISRLFSQVVA